MQMNFKFIKQCSSLVLAVVLFTGCTAKSEKEILLQSKINEYGKQITDYKIIPETFSLSVNDGNDSIIVSQSEQTREVTQFIKNGTETAWKYANEKIAVSVKLEKEYLHVTITSETTDDNEFQWPNVSGESYYLPFGEGKYIPAADETWISYLKGNQFNALEELSMPFWAVANGDYAVLYIMENPYRSTLAFSEESDINFSLLHQYPEIDKEKENSFRIYLTNNNPVSVAKIYRQYVIEQGNFVTLEEKAEKNPNIRKLYGAPQIYLWGDHLISHENINWPAFRNSSNSNVLNYIKKLASEKETGNEFVQTIQDISNQDYVGQYQKNTICQFLSEILKENDFYNAQIFPKQDEYMKTLLQKELGNLEKFNIIQLNKHALATNLPEVFQPVDEWTNENTINLIQDFKNSGMEKAWIGLNSWEQAYAKPELVETAIKEGYLIGPYDSYHSIHEPKKEQWITARFEDTSLYENATVLKQNGEKEKGFQNVGRKLNPTLSMPSVKQRVSDILKSGISFNSWFIDCDATGEIYDDYSLEHITTQQEDLNARLERMAYIGEQNIVIGSEGGNDFAASVIAFAHGIELKSFSWIDEDMKNNKESEYYIGKYYNPTGGVAEHFSKRIPIKQKYYTIFVDPRYDLPLYKLVYNDSVITSYHWDWSTFKITGAVQSRMLRELLYNTPPLYHLDIQEWKKYKEDISEHTKIWSQFSKQAILQEMTNFRYLTEDGSVQMSEYGKNISVIANFTDISYIYEKEEIPKHSLLLEMNGEKSVYTPNVSDENK